MLAQRLDLSLALCIPEAKGSDPPTVKRHPTAALVIADLVPECSHRVALWIVEGVYEALEDGFEHVAKVYCLVAVFAQLVEALENQFII